MELKYTKEQQEQAFQIYRETQILSRASEFLSIPMPVLSKWKKDNDWDSRIERDNSALALAPLSQDQNVERLCQRFEIPKEDGEVLKQIKLVEGICMATIKGKTNVTEKLALTPPNWDSAIKTLDTCWKWRNTIFERKIKQSKAGNGLGTDSKPNILIAVQQTMKGDGSADNTIEVTSGGESHQILPEQTLDTEWREDQESE